MRSSFEPHVSRLKVWMVTAVPSGCIRVDQLIWTGWHRNVRWQVQGRVRTGVCAHCTHVYTWHWLVQQQQRNLVTVRKYPVSSPTALFSCSPFFSVLYLFLIQFVVHCVRKWDSRALTAVVAPAAGCCNYTESAVEIFSFSPTHNRHSNFLWSGVFLGVSALR
jgi:hypothetical protein